MKGTAARTVLITAVVALLAGVMILGDRFHLSPEELIAHRESLLSAVDRNYAASVFVYLLVYICTALFLPGALVLTLAGGMLFGTLPALVYVNIGATVGSLLAFRLSRSFLGKRIQERFSESLVRFNEELERHGHSYLLVLRIIPLIPFFAVNYGAGLTRIPPRTFAWTTSVGMLPGSFIYTLAGHRLRSVTSWDDLNRGPVLAVLGALAVFALLPVFIHHLQHRR